MACQTWSFLGSRWESLSAGQPFEYTFVDDIFAGHYRAEEREFTILVWLSVLAIFIACLGLFGLASFSAARRTREIGIRKALGAGIGNILVLFFKEFTVLVTLSVLLAWPIAYYLMHRWLEDFPYRVGVGWGTLLFFGVMALLFALTTVSYQAVRAATANPTQSLRYK